MLQRTIQINTYKADIEEKGIKLKLTVVDTPGFGDAINNNKWYVEIVFNIHNYLYISYNDLFHLSTHFSWEPIIEFVDQQYDTFFQDESGLNRKNMSDTRVHCCLHFINPQGHG